MEKLIKKLKNSKFDFNIEFKKYGDLWLNFYFNNKNKSKFRLELEEGEEGCYWINLDEYDIFIEGIKDFSFYLNDEYDYNIKDIFKILNFIYDIDNNFLKYIKKGMDGKSFDINDNIYININVDRYEDIYKHI